MLDPFCAINRPSRRVRRASSQLLCCPFAPGENGFSELGDLDFSAPGLFGSFAPSPQTPALLAARDRNRSCLGLPHAPSC
jgi:hypothetical protein